MISKTIVLKFNPINNFFIYISVKDHGGVFFNPETFGTKTRIWYQLTRGVKNVAGYLTNIESKQNW